MIMPGMSAAETYASLSARSPDVRVLLVTGSTRRAEIEALLAMGVRASLGKPFDGADRRAVDRLLRR